MAELYPGLRPCIEAAVPKLAGLNALLGFDGTVDVICRAVQSRQGSGSQFTPFPRIRDFGQRINEADGKSAIVEIVSELEKIGGNGPIMARALSNAGIAVDYIGPLGQPVLHPVYQDFAKRIRVHSVAQPAVTHALEFSNGKVMLAAISSYETILAERLETFIGREAIIRLIAQSQLCCLLNWTCLPGMNSILEWYLRTLLPELGPNRERIFFFDLADPSMRSREDLMGVLRLIQGFEAYGRTVLGMNLNEAQQVCRTLGIPEPVSEKESLCTALTHIRERLGIHTAMAHPTDFAACATAGESWAVDGPHTASPSITTGAGDHLNAGFCLALLLGFSPEHALGLGVLFSGYYVRTAQSPDLADIIMFVTELESI